MLQQHEAEPQSVVLEVDSEQEFVDKAAPKVPFRWVSLIALPN
jgi:hypothetical protein